MNDQRPLEGVPDDELLRRLIELTQRSRRVEADLVAHIAEVDERRLYAREASPSMFAYCTGILHLSEAEAYLRIAAARASREHPMLLTMLGDGRLHLTGIAKLAPHLTPRNRDDLLRRATHGSKRQIEELIVEIAPKPDVSAAIWKLPEAHGTSLPTLRPRSDIEPGSAQELRPDAVPSSPTAAPVSRAYATVVQPLAPARYKVQFTASAEFHDKLERLRGLMLSQVPNGDLAEVIERAVTEKLERLEARRFARSSRPRKGLGQTDTGAVSRHLPAAVKRVVRARDGGRCRFVDGSGRRCPERSGLEYHHRLPFGMGGDHRPQNLSLLCRTHNQYLAEQDYGRQVMARHHGSTAYVTEHHYASGEGQAPWLRSQRSV